MILGSRHTRLVVTLLALVVASSARATVPNAADDSIRQFLAQKSSPHSYRAVRRLEAENGGRKAWMEASTEYSHETGFRYEITGEGGSAYIRSHVLKVVLEGERESIAKGEAARSTFDPVNYTFEPNGLDTDGLAIVQLTPRRKDRALISGTMVLNASNGVLVRVEGRLAKNPSFWLKNVDIVRTYARIDGAVVPIAHETKAQVRFLGNATLNVTYVYSEIDGRRLASNE